MNYYPAFLNIRGKKVVVIGGGSVAERKCCDLLDCGALVTVVACSICEDLLSLHESFPSSLSLFERAYQSGDLDGAALVIAATDSSEVNRTVYAEAAEKGIFCNAVDDIPNSSFIVPSVMRKGDLTVAVSTSGAAPSYAAKIRRQLEASLPSDAEEIVAALKTARELLKSSSFALDPSKRGDILRRITADDGLLLELKSAAERGEKDLINFLIKFLL